MSHAAPKASTVSRTSKQPAGIQAAQTADMAETIIATTDEPIDMIGAQIVITDEIIAAIDEIIRDMMNVMKLLRSDSPTEITVASNPPAFANVSIAVLMSCIAPEPKVLTPVAARSVIGFCACA
jgi:hypothetical protein